MKNATAKATALSNGAIVETVGGGAAFVGPGNSVGPGNGEQIETTWEFITPAIAAVYLQRNIRNRRFMPGVCEVYTRMMKGGEWEVTHEGIAFTKDDELIDGRHRLQAVVDSGVSQWMLVTYGLDPIALEVINRGRMRTLAHNLQILGLTAATTRMGAVARMMYKGPKQINRQQMPSDVAMRRFIEEHMASLVFALEAIPEKTGPAPVAAVVARAWYHADRNLLRRFGAAMMDHIPKEEQRAGDRSARMLNKFIVGQRSTGYVKQAACYFRTQSALRAYLDGRDLESLRESQEDVFPLPA